MGFSFEVTKVMNGERNTALKIYKIGRCEGVSGVDLFYLEKNAIAFNEANIILLYIACQIFKNVERSRRI